MTTATDVLAAAAALSGYTADDLRGWWRAPPLVRWRHLAMHVAHEAGVSVYGLGKQFNRQRSSVRHALGKIDRLMSDPDVAADRERLVSAVMGGRQRGAGT